MKPLWDYEDYRLWVKDALERRGHGSQSALATAVRCQPSYLTKILKRETDFSLEQAEAAASFFQLDELDTEALLLLVMKGRAGTPSLRKRFEKKLAAMEKPGSEEFRAREIVSTKQEGPRRFSNEDLKIFYSRWYYAAAHILMGKTGQHTVDSLAAQLLVPRASIQIMLRHLERMGMIVFKDGSYRMAETEFLVDAGADIMKEWHRSWRIRLLQSLDTPLMKGDFHFTILANVDEHGLQEMKKTMREMFKKFADIANSCQPDKAFVVHMDLTPVIQSEHEA